MYKTEKKSTNSMAVTRTVLANERTLLAYIRTSLTFAITGVGILKFIEDGMTVILVGWGMILAGAILFLVGLLRYKKLSESIK
jgi:putative membrane protein